MSTKTETIVETEKYHTYWHDADQTILITHVKRSWNWQDALKIVSTAVKAIESQDHNVYSLLVFTGTGGLIPAQTSFLDMRNMMVKNPPNEKLLIFVGVSPITRKFMEVASETYNLHGIMSHYRFARHMREAIAIVEEDRAEK